MIDNVAILVVSFDGYSDVWPTFFECKNKYWKDCIYKTYIVTNHKDFKGNCIVIKTGQEISWCERLESALKSVPETNIILLLEDYFIGKPINSKKIDCLLTFFSKEKANYLRLINIPRKHGSDKKKEIYPILANEEYGVNLQPAIWNKDYLVDKLSQIEGTRSAWDFEISLLKQCSNYAEPLVGCYGTKENVLNIHNGVLKGKWFKNEVDYFRSNGIVIDTSARGVLSNKEYYNHLIRRTVRETIPPNIRKTLKKLLSKFNIKFVSNV